VLNSWRRLRSIRFAALVLFGVASIAAFAATAAFNGEPSPPPFNGWVAILEQFDAGDQVMLTVSSDNPDSERSRPTLSYQVSVCGDQPFDALLVAGGDARLSAVGASPPFFSHTELGEVPTVKDVPDLTFNGGFDLGRAQITPVTFRAPPPCASGISPVPPFPKFTGASEYVSGLAQAPIRQDSGLPWWTGPRSSETWPLVGTLLVEAAPFNPENDLTGSQGLSGEWGIRVPDYIEVPATPPNDSSVEEANPQPVSTATGLTWEGGADPIQPSARLTNVAGTSAWQQGQVISGIALGIFGSLLATWLLLGRPAEDASVTEVRAGLESIQGELDVRAQLAATTAERDAAITAAEAERQRAVDQIDDLRRTYEDRITQLRRADREEPPGPRRRRRPKESGKE
jgi:hypothetical protein